MKDFDKIVIVSGRAEHRSAQHWRKWMADHAGREAMGRRRLYHDGCTSTKTMIASPRVAALARRGKEYGIHGGPVSVDLKSVRAHTNELVSSRRKHIEDTLRELPNLS